MAKFICNKLARDNTIEGMAKDAIRTTYKQLKHKELLEALRKKLLEESLEVAEATKRTEVINELADVFEVIDALRGMYGITYTEVSAAKATIYRKRGGFKKAIFLETIEMSESNPYVKHFRASPSRYPEVRSKHRAG